jgi:hypothetical protein
MPATPFIRKGCTLTLYDNDKIKLSTAEVKHILSGKEIDGLYYFQCTTVSPSTQACAFEPARGGASIPPSGTAPPAASSFFGLPVGRKISETANDFAQRLLEAHFAYGHLNFTKLRKCFGLKAGDNPHCATCAVAQSRQAPLNKVPDRSTRINHRMHGDIGFTAGSSNPYIDDYTRRGYLDLLTCFRSDNEYVYTSNAWIAYCRETGLEHY